VDVRDVAIAHCQAMVAPEAAGHRHILCSGTLSFKAIAQHVSEFSPEALDLSKSSGIPDFFVKIVAVFDRRMKGVANTTHRFADLDVSGSEKRLGMKWKDVPTTLKDTAKSLIELGLIKHPTVNAK
jgi:nucleoside-diphosphate-sugar epimerase